jgi:hypothetical protein
MKKLAITTAIALALGTAAYAQGHPHGMSMGGGGGGGASFKGAGPTGGGPGANFNAGARTFSGANTMGPSHGPANLYNRAPTTNTYSKTNAENFNENKDHYTQRGPHQLYNRYENNHVPGNSVEGRSNFQRRGIVSGNFFEHGRHFRFRRFLNGEWVFLTDWNDCTAWAWVNVAPGIWAWRPIDVCIG